MNLPVAEAVVAPTITVSLALTAAAGGEGGATAAATASMPAIANKAQTVVAIFAIRNVSSFQSLGSG